MDKISVIIPAYNAEKTIVKCITSILQGRKGPYEKEIIVVNDGSTDSTGRIVANLAQKYDEIILVSQENSGVASARQNGVRSATGDFIAWCDSDDYVESEWLCNLYSRMKKYDADISICRARIAGLNVEYDPSELTLWNRSDAVKEFLIHKRLNGSLVVKMFRRELFDNISFSSDMSYWEDDYVVWKILQKTDKVVKCNEGTYNYIIHSSSLCAKKMSENRVYSMLKLWDCVIEDCRLFHNEHLQLALNKQYENAISIWAGMMKSGLYNCEYEQRLERIIKTAGIVGAFRQKGIFKSLFALGLLINYKIVRMFCNIVYKCKS